MDLLAVVSCLLTVVSSIRCSNEVPLIVWGSGSEHFSFHVPAHRKLSAFEFHEGFLKKLTSDEPHAIAAFIEESLSPEDLVSQDADKESKYPHLQKTLESDKSIKYLPYVENPVKAIKALDYEAHELPSSESPPSLPGSAKKLFVVNLDDAREDEGRLRLLQRHDKVINKLCSEIQQKYEKTVCILTAKQASWIEPKEASQSGRKLLQTTDTVENGGGSDTLNVYYQANAGMVYTKNLPTLFIKDEKKVINLTIPSNPMAVKGTNALVLYLESSVGSNDRARLSFNFILPNMTATWQLSSVGILYPTNTNKTRQLRAISYVGASIGNSFHSPSNVTFEDDDYVLTFRGLQAQYFATPNRQQVFGPAEDSVYFFTIPILSGLFVSSLLVTIVLIGLTMIYDVKTMDQFDDPKGKSITINASE